MGIAPTGKPVRRWYSDFWDELGVMQQQGIEPLKTQGDNQNLHSGSLFCLGCCCNSFIICYAQPKATPRVTLKLSIYIGW